MSNVSPIVSLRLVADTLDAWAVFAEERHNSPYATAIHGNNYRDRAANYRDQSKRIREAIESVSMIGQQALTEITAIHSHHQPECLDKGPCTCSTWHVIHGLRHLLGLESRYMEGGTTDARSH